MGKGVKAAKDVIQAYLCILQGMVCTLHTDRLNSTIMSAVLKQPEKVLRLILWIESSVHAVWRFLPGVMNPVGDGFSRNPPDRDDVQEEVETKSLMPKTLGEAFEQARRSAGTYLDDESLNSMHTTFPPPRPEDWCAVLNPAPSGTVRVNATSKVK